MKSLIFLKRSFKTIAGVAIAATMLSTTPVHAQDKIVVFAGFGGTLQKVQRLAFFEPFEKERGIKVIDVPDSQLMKLKAMVDAGNTQWDSETRLASCAST